MRGVVVGLGLAAALFFALAGALQHYATRSLALATQASTRTGTRTGPVAWLPVLGLLPQLLRSPIWLAGLSANIAGFGFHAAALHLGSVTIVQALLVVQLLFALPFATVRNGAPLLARDWLGTAAVCTGIITLLIIRGDTPQTVARRGWIAAVAMVAVLVIAGLVTAAHALRPYPQTRTALVGVAAGVCFSVTAVLIVVVTDDMARQGLWAGLLGWPTIGLAASGLTAAILGQEAFAAGAFPTALTAMTIADPVASWISGTVLFDVDPPTGTGPVTILAASSALLVTGIVLLATSPTLHDERVAP
jgi:hypothetical protein